MSTENHWVFMTSEENWNINTFHFYGRNEISIHNLHLYLPILIQFGIRDKQKILFLENPKQKGHAFLMGVIEIIFTHVL